MSGRFTRLFRRLEGERRGALVPFAVLGDPDPETSAARLEILAEGADALEVGLPFSDPIADGPTIQRAALRAREAGTSVARGLELVAALRARRPDLPIGLLVYANLVHAQGLRAFYARAAEAGIDAVLVPDVPYEESAPFAEAARAAGVAPVLIAPPNAPEATLAGIARTGREYTYVVTRKGITGVGRGEVDPSVAVVHRLAELGAPPALLGFGIARPEHVRRALATGARGAIVGSALVERFETDPASVPGYLAELRAATSLSSSGRSVPPSVGGGIPHAPPGRRGEDEA